MKNVNEEILPFVKITKSFMQIPNESTDNTTPSCLEVSRRFMAGKYWGFMANDFNSYQGVP